MLTFLICLSDCRRKFVESTASRTQSSQALCLSLAFLAFALSSPGFAFLLF